MTKSKTKTVALGDIIIRYDLYPRLPNTDVDSSQSYQAVDSYKLAIEDLPPIVINQDNILVDGWHRWEAYRLLLEDIQDEMVDEDIKLSKDFDPSNIEVIVIQTESEEQILFEAAKANAEGHVVMSRQEKRNVAERLTDKFTDNKIAKALGLPRSTVNYWTKEHREAMLRVAKELVYEYADKHPDAKQTAIRKMILDEHGIRVPHSSHSDWLRDRKEIEADWSEKEIGLEQVPLGGVKAGAGDMTLEEFQKLSDGKPTPEMVAKIAESTTETVSPTIPYMEYICDGYDPKWKSVSTKEYLQTGCLKCNNLQSTPFTGVHHEGNCKKGHQTVITGWVRDR